MKVCLVCGAECKPNDATCHTCGEASWGPTRVYETEAKAEKLKGKKP